jgi:oligoribonuclease (3'-5' exoribonuclease)
MKYVSVDLETTGLDESYCQILEFAAVIGDTTDFCTPVEEFPSLTYRFYYDRVIGDPYALHLNRGLLNDMVSRPSSYLYINIDSLWSYFANWLDTQKFAIEGKVMLAGKNVGSFDRRFLNRVLR